MTPIRTSPATRFLCWLLAVAFMLAPLPAPSWAQEESPAPELAPAPTTEVPDVQPPESPAPAPETGSEPAPEAVAAPPTETLPPGAEAFRARVLQRARPAGTPPADQPAPEEPAEETTGELSATAEGEETFTPKFQEAPLDQLLDEYSRLTGRVMIKAPGVNATFTLKAKGEKLTRAEAIQAMDSLLSMNNLALVPLGSRFYRVVQIANASTEGLAIQRETPEGGHPDSDALVSHLINLKYLEMEDAANIVQAMLHGFGKVQRFDRISSLLVTETSANLKRIAEILEMVDQPTEARVETRVYEIKHAKASEIAARLNELVSDSQGEKKEEVAQVAQVAPPVAARRPPSMVRARQPAPAGETPAADTAAALEAAMAERGIVQGKVKIIADERTNIIIVISRPSNFAFFDKIVAVLDRPVDPEVIVQVIALEFADAEEIAGLLNDFIGAAKSETEAAAPKAGEEAGAADTRARALEELVRARAAAADRVRQAAGEAAASKIGQLSPNTKILPDKRTNTLLLMGTKGDIAALREIVKKVDIMLAQVLIEAVILEVNLNNNTTYGVNWLQKSMTAYSARQAGANGGVSLREPVASWGGNFGENNFATAAGETITRAFAGGSGLSYYFTFAELNMDLLLRMVAASGEGRVLATPVILTTDNTEASIMSGQQIPIRTGDTESSGGTYRSDYEYKDVGIQLKVKPRINPSRYVTLEITQNADTLGDPVDIGNNETMTSINKREMTASISVPSRSTIVLGGLVQTDYLASDTHVPILGSIPLIGALFRSESKTRKRTELLVLITPYVLMTPDEARQETERLHHASNVAAEDWYRGWSDSSLAPFSPERLREMKQAESLSRRAKLKPAPGSDADVDASPPVALIEPAAPMPKPTPEAMNPEEFGRELERAMSGPAAAPDSAADASPTLAPTLPLPAPEEPATTAPFAFDPAVPATPAEPPAPAPAERKPRRAKRVKEEPKPSMFPAPSSSEDQPKGDAP